MPEILRNLAIAGFLQRLGALIWLGEFKLVFCKGICYNIFTFPISCANDVVRLGPLLRAFSIALIFFAYEHFILSFSQTSIFKIWIFI